jgi:hypothetical protein
MAELLELATLDLAGGQRQAGVLALEHLDPGQYVGAHAPFAALGQGRGLAVEGAESGHLGVEVGISGRWRQPCSNQVRLEVPDLFTCG